MLVSVSLSFTACPLQRQNKLKFDKLERSTFEDDMGYALFDFDMSSVQIYGGIYFKDNVIIMVSNANSKHKYSDEALIDSFLDKIGYPKP